MYHFFIWGGYMKERITVAVHLPDHQRNYALISETRIHIIINTATCSNVTKLIFAHRLTARAYRRLILMLARNQVQKYHPR